jgi:hypothetical protein
MKKLDDQFFNRADEHIHLANEQITTTKRGKVSASMMYAVARFNSWVSACSFNSGKEMEDAKEETIQYFLTEYEKMLRDNLEDYIDNFETYMKRVEDN